MKKFISLSLAIMMMVGVLTAVNFTSVYASTTEVCEWKYWDDTNQRMYNNSGKTGSQYFYKTSSATGSLTYYENGNGISTSPVLELNTSYFVTYPRTKINLGDKEVINFGWKAYVREEDFDSTIARQVNFTLAEADSSNSYENDTYGTVYFTYVNKSGKAYGGATKNATNVDTRASLTVTPDTWHQFNIRVFLNEANKITYGMYIDGRLLIVCKSTAKSVDLDKIGINTINFTGQKTTYIKDLSLTLEDYDAIYEPDYSVVALSDVLFNSFSLNDSTAKDMSVPGYGVAAQIFQPATGGTSSYYCTDSSSRVFDNVDYALENDALKVTLTPSSSSNTTYAMIQYFQRDMTSYFPSNETKYMQMSYDVYIPAGTEDTTRRQVWQLGNNTGSKGSACYAIASAVKNNKLWFYNDSTYTGDLLTKKSTTLDVSTDKWYRIIYLLKIENSDNAQYAIHTEGYVLDIAADTTYKIYEVDGTIPKAKAGTNGLTLCAQRMYAETPKATGSSTVETKYDNIISRISSTNFSEYYMNITDKLPTDENYVFDIDFAVNGTVATARGRDADGNGAQKILIAGYDASGRMVKCAVSDSTSIIDGKKGIVEFSWDFSGYSTITKIKAFMFESLTSCVPLAKAATWTQSK